MCLCNRLGANARRLPQAFQNAQSFEHDVDSNVDEHSDDNRDFDYGEHNDDSVGGHHNVDDNGRRDTPVSLLDQTRMPPWALSR